MRRIALAGLLALGGAQAQAQSLLELYQAARDFDATYLAARSQFDASQAQADQAR
ncbi:MAG: channel protein TolC, partial [Comamonadaceae bacterium]|nr:channel protein TolC [Comamonadaceae bacterium]